MGFSFGLSLASPSTILALFFSMPMSHTTVPPPPPPPLGQWPGPTIGIFGIAHRQRPSAAALWRVQSEREEIEGERGACGALEQLQQQLSLRGRAERESERGSERLLRRLFPHRSALA